ncbi:putative membrane bound protein [Bacillus phage vB_BmeM-Goe8]|uniref:Putative membrane bound protein n=1 Tax=Bacillus phage vB_BmeM-Goe8 TaxID=2593638 RepID=A0A516KN07_9CAUD|nr:putative membrane bound protein [Bacillus phage vB_BmeM-Goe8]QDP42966.1 putative membrane bound protein [Bacillus phage vB_BmeM-Goe8]
MSMSASIIILNLTMLLLNTAVTTMHSAMVMKEMRKR